MSDMQQPCILCPCIVEENLYVHYYFPPHVPCYIQLLPTLECYAQQK